MKVTAADLKRLGIIEDVIPEQEPVTSIKSFASPNLNDGVL